RPRVLADRCGPPGGSRQPQPGHHQPCAAVGGARPAGHGIDHGAGPRPLDPSGDLESALAPADDGILAQPIGHPGSASFERRPRSAAGPREPAEQLQPGARRRVAREQPPGSSGARPGTRPGAPGARPARDSELALALRRSSGAPGDRGRGAESPLAFAGVPATLGLVAPGAASPTVGLGLPEPRGRAAAAALPCPSRLLRPAPAARLGTVPVRAAAVPRLRSSPGASVAFVRPRPGSASGGPAAIRAFRAVALRTQLLESPLVAELLE